MFQPREGAILWWETTKMCKKEDIIMWNNQQMQLYAVNFIPLLGSLYMFRVFYTQYQATLGVSSWDDSVVCTSGCRYSWKLYSWWWVYKTPETCRVNLAVE